jgi:hypothetical protein
LISRRPFFYGLGLRLFLLCCCRTAEDGEIGVDSGMQTWGRTTSGTGGGQYKYYFNIGSIDSFERKMEEAEEDLGHTPDTYVPITYTSEMSWLQELLRLAPTLLLIGGYVWFTRRQMGGLSGTGGMGGRGIFNVGKAQVCPLSPAVTWLLASGNKGRNGRKTSFGKTLPWKRAGSVEALPLWF